MSSLTWTSVFAAALVASLAMRAWLLARQVRHVALHRGEVPAAFRSSVDLAAHQRAADYTLAKCRLAHWQMVAGAAILLGWTLSAASTCSMRRSATRSRRAPARSPTRWR